MEPTNGCRICMEAFPGVCQTPWFGLAEGSVILGSQSPGLPPSHILYPKSDRGDTQDRHVTPVRPRVIHAAHRRSLTISAVLPEPNLRKLAPEAGKYPGALHSIGNSTASGAW